MSVGSLGDPPTGQPTGDEPGERPLGAGSGVRPPSGDGSTAGPDAQSPPAAGPRSRHAARWSALAVGLVVVVLVAVLASRAPAATTEAYSPLVGRSAPAIDARTFSGAHLRLEDFRGRWLLVNFFAPWCTACQAEEPGLEAFLYSHPGGARTAVLGVLYGDTVADGRTFQRSEGATWPSVVDPGGLIASTYGVGGLPRSFLVAPDGKVAAAFVGAVTPSGLDSVIRLEQDRGL